jgi:hypothetical protein
MKDAFSPWKVDHGVAIVEGERSGNFGTVSLILGLSLLIGIGIAVCDAVLDGR